MTTMMTTNASKRANATREGRSPIMQNKMKWVASALTAAFLCTAGAAGAAQRAPERVQFDSLDTDAGKHAVKIDGYLFQPDGRRRCPAVVISHGSGGAMNKNGTVKLRERDVAQRLAKLGYGVLVVDSHTTRGEASLCSTKLSERPVRGKHYRLDGFGALDYLNQRPDVLKGQIAAFGQTYAGNYALNALDANLLPYGATKTRFAAGVGLSSTCNPVYKRKKTFQAYAPVLLLSAEDAQKN